MKKAKVVHLIHSLDSGGCENMLLRTLPSMHMHEHIVITLHHSGALSQRFMERGIQVINIGQRHLFSLQGLFRLHKTLTELSPTHIITYLFHADAVGRLALPLILHPCPPITPFLRTTYNTPRYYPARLFEWGTRFLVKHYLANSDAVKQFYTTKLRVAAEKIQVIPNGIDTDLYQKNPPNTPDIGKLLHLPVDALIVTCVANLHSNKGHRYLVDAVLQLADHYPHLHLLLVGHGKEYENIRTQIPPQYTSRVILLGQRSDVRDILAGSHIFVLPTFFEGLSNAIQEAMAMNLPVITTDIPENRILIQDQKNGLLIPPRSTEAIKKALTKLLDDSDKRDTLGHNARHTILQSYSLTRSAELFSAYLNQTV